MTCASRGPAARRRDQRTRQRVRRCRDRRERDALLERYGTRDIASVLTELNVTRDDLVADLRAALPPVIEAAKATAGSRRLFAPASSRSTGRRRCKRFSGDLPAPGRARDGSRRKIKSHSGTGRVAAGGSLASSRSGRPRSDNAVVGRRRGRLRSAAADRPTSSGRSGAAHRHLDDKSPATRQGPFRVEVSASACRIAPHRLTRRRRKAGPAAQSAKSISLSACAPSSMSRAGGNQRCAMPNTARLLERGDDLRRPDQPLLHDCRKDAAGRPNVCERARRQNGGRSRTVQQPALMHRFRFPVVRVVDPQHQALRADDPRASRNQHMHCSSCPSVESPLLERGERRQDGARPQQDRAISRHSRIVGVELCSTTARPKRCHRCARTCPRTASDVHPAASIWRTSSTVQSSNARSARPADLVITQLSVCERSQPRHAAAPSCGRRAGCAHTGHEIFLRLVGPVTAAAGRSR